MEEQILEFQKSKRDRIILSDEELNRYVENLANLLAKNQNLFVRRKYE